jgi:hypothetical protein
MGKSRTRGHRGLYLKGKGVAWVRDLVPNLMSNRIRDSLRIRFDFFDYASVLFPHLKVFTKHGMRPGRHGHRECTMGCSGGTVHAGGSSRSAIDSMRQGGELGQRRPWLGSVVLRQWQ